MVPAAHDDVGRAEEGEAVHAPVGSVEGRPLFHLGDEAVGARGDVVSDEGAGSWYGGYGEVCVGGSGFGGTEEEEEGSEEEEEYSGGECYEVVDR